MNPKSLDPRRLDVAALARDERQLDGVWPQSGFARLADARHDAAAPAPPVRYAARGELRRRPGADPEPWLHLQVGTTLTMTCQRCLGPLDEALEVDRWLHFVADEETAATLDADSEDDVLPLERTLDLHALAEDELLLELPIVPRHAVCPDPPRLAFEAEGGEPAAHPFAGLAAIKKRPDA